MPSIIWKPITGHYYAYLQECFYDPTTKGPKTKNIYLGSTPEKAEEKLRRVVTDSEQLTFFVGEIYRKQPAGRPPADEKAVAVKALNTLSRRLKDEAVKAVILRAIKELEE